MRRLLRFPPIILALAMAVPAADEPAPRSAAPSYELSTILNAASLAGDIAPNSLVLLLGKNLAWTERYRRDEDVRGDVLPTSFPGIPLTVTVNSLAVPLEYVSPDSLLFLMPAGLKAGPVTLTVTAYGLRGPRITLDLKEFAPGVFLFEEGFALARHEEDMDFITGERPAAPGETIRLYATGLGTTDPPQKFGRMPLERAELTARAQFSVVLAGQRLEPERTGYAGVLPKYPGFYEIELRLPDEMPADPEIWVCVGEVCSQGGVKLRTQRTAPPEPPEAEPQPDGARLRFNE